MGRGNCSSSPYESQIESYEHQDNSYVHDQPFPKLTLEEEEIYADDDGYQQQYVKDDNYLSFHVNSLGVLNLNISKIGKTIREANSLVPRGKFTSAVCDLAGLGFGVDKILRRRTLGILRYPSTAKDKRDQRNDDRPLRKKQPNMRIVVSCLSAVVLPYEPARCVALA
jgi:hypothetical protein